MKIIIVVLTLILFPFSGVAQASLDFLEDIAGVETLVITKDAYALLSKFNPEKFKDSKEIKVFQMATGLEEFKIFSSKDPVIANKIASMSQEALKKQNLTRLKGTKEKEVFVEVYTKATKNNAFASTVVLFIKEMPLETKGASEARIIVLKGNLEIQQIPKLAAIFVLKNG
ncbi:DUF4252 domain-containing protein [Polaribacter sp.]|nr:DUF4252 domain-containing protein [Polaribacter sp.]